ncbi:helix-turn-helix domain-containing protein [Leucobacter aridicollis]|uniref:helix-turn-helix domain-containing protein n=1 Tax=Leucobacter aridicollis TaxID=283878 RepID=UPI00210442CA|nr:helix-turn-helix transcriptional regulator [Leucobacter aridicollis]UTX51959.1 helix-turn-helix transcriptional regulator [Leucobacter aridicollis]
MRRLRHGRGETLSDTAKRAGVSPQYLSEMERGSKDPSSEMIEAVAGALEVTLLDLTLAVTEALRGGESRSGSVAAAPASGGSLAPRSVAHAAPGASRGSVLALAA